MAKTQFSSKLLTQSLAYRVLAICLTLLVIPLLFFSVYLWVQDIEIGIFSPLIFLIISIVLIGGVGTLFLIHKMAKPLMQLRQVMSYVGKGVFHLRFHQDKWGFEINELGADFNEMIESLLVQMQRADQEKIARQLLENELKIGHAIQKNLFPKHLPQLPGLDLAAHFIPSQEVSGDFYDLFMTRSNQLLIVMADVSGKGISACLYAFLVRSMLRAISFKEKNLREAIQLTNHLFSMDTGDSGYFVTAWIGLYDPVSQILEYSCCGHPPALLQHADGSIEELGDLSGALGVRELQQTKTRSISFSPGEVLLLYTDGLIEARNEKNEMYGKQRLIDDMKAVPFSNSQNLVEKLTRHVQDHCKGEPLHDDLTLLALHITK